MPGAMEIKSPAKARFQRVLQERLKYAREDMADVLLHKAKDAALQFYFQTKKAIPDKSEIIAAVKRQGWQLVENRGKTWQVINGKKVGPWPRKDGEPRGSQGPKNRMMAGVIERRLKGRGYVATGWLPAVRRFGGSANRGVKIVDVKNPRGYVKIESVSPNVFRITIANSTPGVVYVDKKYHVIQFGLNEASKDCIKYIREKRAGRSGESVGGNS